MRRLVAAILLSACASCTLTARAGGTRAPSPDATPGGEITLAIARPATIDPADAFERSGRLVDSLLCDPLIQIDPITGELRPALAESWVVGTAATSITLKLRKGVRFHDGTPVTAEDVAYELSRVASQEEASNVAPLLRPIAGYAAYHGDEEAKTAEQASTLAGVHAIGTYAVQIALAEPRADFLRVLAQTLATPVPRALVARDEAAFAASPVCTGPYRMARPWHAGDPTIELVRAESYYGRNRGFTRGGAGYADRIVLRTDDRDPNADVRPAAAASRGPGVVDAPTSYLEYIGLPTGVAPFDRRAVRIALSRAIDRAAIARDVYRDIRAPARGYIPPADGSVHRAAACGEDAPVHPDVAGARRMLGGLALPPMTLSYNPDLENEALARAIAAQWRDAFGVEVSLRAVGWDSYSKQTQDSRSITGPFRMGWTSPYPGPDAALAPLFSTNAIGSDNRTLFTDARFDRALERDARRATSEEDVRRQYRRLEDIVCEQMPAIPVVFGGHRYAVRERIGSAVGAFTDVVTGEPLLRELFVRR